MPVRRLDDRAESDGIDDTVVLRWSGHPRCVGLARNELRRALHTWGLSRVEDTAVLVLSEIFSDVVRHVRVPPGREIESRYIRTSEGLRLEVHDDTDGSYQPALERPVLQDEFGSQLLQALTHRCGTAQRGANRWVVWAELAPDFWMGPRDDR